jgi:hypothetical protein
MARLSANKIAGSSPPGSQAPRAISLFILRLFMPAEIQRGGIDAIAQTCRLRSVWKYMSQMGLTARAMNLGPAHEKAVIFA